MSCMLIDSSMHTAFTLYLYKVEEVKWKGLGVNDHWQQMKGIMMETAQDICGMTGSTQTQGNVVVE